MEKIQSIRKSKTIDYSDKRIERFWLEENTHSSQQTADYRTMLIEAVSNSTNSVICVQSEQIDDSELIKALHKASKNNRIYILTNEKPLALKNLAGCCLLRYGVKNIGSFILINAGMQDSDGYLFTAPFLESSFASNNIMLTLDADQTKTLFRFFCNGFWNKASREIIDDFNSDIQVSEPPLDFLPNMNDFCSEDYVKKACTAPFEQARMMIPELRKGSLIDYTIATDSTILIQFGDVDEQALAEIIKNNNKLYALKNMYAQFLLTENGKSFLVPKPYISETDSIFALELNETQKAMLIQNIRSCIDNPEYRYLHTGKRGEYAERTIYFTSDTKKAIQIKAQSDSELAAVSCTKLFERNVFENQEPQFQDDGVSCSIRYSWEVQPFFLPNGVKKARLYDEWEAIEQGYKAFCDRLKQDIDEEAGRQNITDRLKRFFLGKNQKFTQYKSELHELATKQLSTLEKSERKNIINTVNKIRQNISSDKKDIDNEIKKEAIDDTIADLEHKKTEREKELLVLQKDLKNKLQEKEVEIQALKEKATEAKIGENTTSQTGKTDQRPESQNSQINQADIEKKEKERSILIRKYTNDEKSIRGSIKKFERDIEQKQKEKARIGQDNKNAAENESSLTVFKKKSHKGNAKDTAFAIPDSLEPLPKVGTLYEGKGTRYLEIACWEEYQTGIEECKRFNARLCAQEGVHNG